MTKETLGKISSDLLKKEPETTDPIELQREIHKNYEEQMYICINRAKQDLPTGDFYIVIETKKERLMLNVLRNYFVYRYSCPTPTNDQTVYKFHRKEDRIEFLWVIPSHDTCEYFKKNALTIPDDQRELLKYILDFEDGTLLIKAKKLNGEQEDSPLLEK